MAEGDTVTKKASDVGVPMIEGSPDEPTGPEDAAGIGNKRGDYSSRNDGQKHFSMERDADGDIVAVDQSDIIENSTPAVPPEGTKGGVDSAGEGGPGTQNAVVTIQFADAPTSGTVTLEDQDGVEYTINWDDTPAEVKTTLAAGATFEATDIPSCTTTNGGSLDSGELCTIRFGGSFEGSDEPDLVMTADDLVSGTAAVNKTQHGGEGPGL
jgi:hypothetical protein